MALNLASIFGSNVGQLFKDVVGTFKLDPTKKAEIQAAIDDNSHEIAVKQLELELKIQDAVSREIESASSNIRAEATSGDKFTSRARPSFIYMMLGIMICNYVVFPLIGKPTIQYPEPLFWLFGSCMLGYTGMRTWEKIGLPKK
jgi:hypothetical protein